MKANSKHFFDAKLCTAIGTYPGIVLREWGPGGVNLVSLRRLFLDVA